jgi:parallel beta-helix repeat protein
MSAFRLPPVLLLGLVCGSMLGFAPHGARADTAAARCPADAIVILPGRSIQAAVDAAGPMARFCIAPGVHRQQSITPRSGQRFLGLPGSILNGARVLASFRRHGDQWVAEADDPIGVDAGACARGHGACARPAGLFLDGRPVQRAASVADLQPGQFFFDPGRRRIVLAADPTGHLVEWAVTRHAFAGQAHDVAIEGLVIEKYVNPAQEGAIWPGGRGWKLSHIEARYNNGVGLVAGSGGVIEDCDVHHNGQLGIGAGGATDVLIRGNQVWDNNANGFDDEWEAGGIKIAVSRNVIFEGNHVHHNAGPGIWCDENCGNVVIRGNTVEANTSAGIFYEISADAVIRGNILSENGVGHSWFWGADIQVAASHHVVVTDNIITVAPGGKAIMLIDQNRWKAGGGYYETRDNQVEGNRMTFLGDGIAGGASDAGPAAANYGIIQKGNNSFDRNDYSFRSGSTLHFVWGEGFLDFPAFRDRGQERNGRLISIAPNPVAKATP